MCAYQKAIQTISMQLHVIVNHSVHFVSIWVINKCQSGIDFFQLGERKITPVYD